MTRPLQLLAIAGVLLFISLSSACGSGGDAESQPSASETPSSERAYRQASIMQQQEGSVSEQGDGEQQADPVAEHGDGDLGDGEGGGEDLEVMASGEIDFGHRIGLPFSRNVVGDPDAPVLIVEYSDYQ